MVARGEFVQDRPTDAIRTPNPWRPYAHYIAVLTDGIAEAIGHVGLGPGSRVLDFGCADRPYWRFFGPDIEVVGADLPGNTEASVEIRPDGTLPLADGSFDLVLSTQVLEHVEDPSVYLHECWRVLRPGGQLVVTTHGYFQFHPDPVDYWRWTGQGLRKLIETKGFTVSRLEGIFGFGAVGLQFCVDSFVPRLPKRLRRLAYRASHTLIRTVDNRQGPVTKRFNASVFAVTATRPE